jgi:hypothetical protein
LNGEEKMIDYGGHCGSCDDKKLSPLIGETDIDYGGYFCGSCSNNSKKNSDAIWAVSENKTIPFSIKICEKGQSTLMISIIVIITVLLFMVVIYVIGFGSLLWIISFFIMSIIRQISKRKEKEGKNRNI